MRELRGKEDQRERWSNWKHKPKGKANRWFQRSCSRRSIFTDISKRKKREELITAHLHLLPLILSSSASEKEDEKRLAGESPKRCHILPCQCSEQLTHGIHHRILLTMQPSMSPCFCQADIGKRLETFISYFFWLLSVCWG